MFLTMRSVKCSNRQIREAVQSSDLEAFKIQLSKALSNQQLVMLWAEGWTWGPFLSQTLCDSETLQKLLLNLLKIL